MVSSWRVLPTLAAEALIHILPALDRVLCGNLSSFQQCPKFFINECPGHCPNGPMINEALIPAHWLKCWSNTLDGCVPIATSYDIERRDSHQHFVKSKLRFPWHRTHGPQTLFPPRRASTRVGAALVLPV